MDKIRKESLIRSIYEIAYNKIKKEGTYAILSSQELIEQRESLRTELISYYESTEEFEKCKFLNDFFIRLEKNTLLLDLLFSLEDRKTNDINRNF